MVAHVYNPSPLNLLDYSEFQVNLSYTVRSCQRGGGWGRDRDRKTERQKDKRGRREKRKYSNVWTPWGSSMSCLTFSTTYLYKQSLTIAYTTIMIAHLCKNKLKLCYPLPLWQNINWSHSMLQVYCCQKDFSIETTNWCCKLTKMPIKWHFS